MGCFVFLCIQIVLVLKLISWLMVERRLLCKSYRLCSPEPSVATVLEGGEAAPVGTKTRSCLRGGAFARSTLALWLVRVCFQLLDFSMNQFRLAVSPSQIASTYSVMKIIPTLWVTFFAHPTWSKYTVWRNSWMPLVALFTPFFAHKLPRRVQ